ncbi:hypothetical protein GCM10007921_30930 [Tritonibacter mobilis]|nr:hypothetical protein GCM10007921_30930 [Tritonibacter mobilis]
MCLYWLRLRLRRVVVRRRVLGVLRRVGIFVPLLLRLCGFWRRGAGPSLFGGFRFRLSYGGRFRGRVCRPSTRLWHRIRLRLNIFWFWFWFWLSRGRGWSGLRLVLIRQHLGGGLKPSVAAI